MRHENAKDLYVLFDKFIEDFLINKNSILSEDINILDANSIKFCKENYIKNYKDNKGSFDEKIKEQFKSADLSTKLVFAHAEWLWSFSVQDINIVTKKMYVKRTLGTEVVILKDEVYPLGFGNAGQWHTNNKYEEIKFILTLIEYLFTKINIDNNDKEKVKILIEDICLYFKYDTEFESNDLTDDLKSFKNGSSLAMTNILSYLGNPDKYEKIVSNAHKENIVVAFSGLIEDDLDFSTKNIDEKIQSIRLELNNYTDDKYFSFYNEYYKNIWNPSLKEVGFSEVQGLQYKKAIILYGPPGTSKTYTAMELAKSLITYAYFKNKKNVREYFTKKLDITKDRIHHLQLHPNYTYEDFIIGYQLKNQNTEITKGSLFDICAKAEVDKGNIPKDDMPHVLILDEINRIDLSRLFGEVFSALENREIPIQVSAGHIKLTIPRNLYVIGTMNEIDFSLERIDFALRRRFLWFFYGYDETILRNIIEFKNKNLNSELKIEEEVNRFIRNATLMNQKISSKTELGIQYQIGHTFFAEIVDIYKSNKEIGGNRNLTNQLYRKSGPTDILWQISLEPMLVSFLGNLEIEVKNEILKDLKTIYNQK